MKCMASTSAPLTPPTHGFVMPTQTAPWRTYGRMMATVLPAFLLLYAALMLTIGVLEWNPILIIGGGLFAIPLVLFVLRITRPSLIHVWNAIPDSDGSTLHNRPDSSSITTLNYQNGTVSTGWHPLEFPSSWSPWALFIGCVFVSIYFCNDIIRDIKQCDCHFCLTCNTIVAAWFLDSRSCMVVCRKSDCNYRSGVCRLKVGWSQECSAHFQHFWLTHF